MDTALLIDEYLKDKQELITNDDSFNVSEGSIVRWDFANVPCPTTEELEALAPVVDSKQAQDKINADALAYLAATDYLIIRELDAGTPCSADIKQARAEARAKIVR